MKGRGVLVGVSIVVKCSSTNEKSEFAIEIEDDHQQYSFFF